MKKITALVLSLVLALSLSVPALAAETAATTAAPAKQDIQVVLNGETVTFPDARPELTSGRTMVPYRALMETLGGEVNYVTGGTITCQLGDTALSFQAGGTTVTKTGPDGKAETIQMDVPCYIKAGRTYVPVRFFAQALGYDVFWDSDDRAAVLVDKNALIDEINQDFAVLNDALAKLQADATKNYKATANANIVMNMDDGTGKMTKMTMKMDMTMLLDSASMEMDAEIDMSSMLTALGLDEAVADGSLTAEEAQAMRDLYSNMTMQMIYNYKTDEIYMNMPALSALAGEEIGWMKMSLGLGDITDLQGKNTVGGVVYLLLKMNALQDRNAPAQIVEQARALSAAISPILGDKAYTKVGSAYQWKLDKSQLDEELAAAFTALNVTIKANADGSMTMTFDIADVSGSLAMSGKGTMTKNTAVVTMTIDMGETGTATMDMNVKMVPTSEKPAAEPPAGATITDMSDMIPSLYDGLAA